MNKRIFFVDAFTDDPFAGNPAAVCLLDGPADERWMQHVAAEMNLSETAFLVPIGEGEWALRWFTPKTEVELCGHATLASAHVLWNEVGIDKPALRFDTRSGWLGANRRDAWICLDFPARPPLPAPLPEGLVDALGAAPESTWRAGEDLLVTMAHADEVRGLEPDMLRLLEVDARGVVVSAASDSEGVDFISRFFAPRVGIPEDPVTGSAHCILAPYWGKRLGKTEMRGLQASARSGVVGMSLENDRVTLQGKAISTLRGQLYV